MATKPELHQDREQGAENVQDMVLPALHHDDQLLIKISIERLLAAISNKRDDSEITTDGGLWDAGTLCPGTTEQLHHFRCICKEPEN